MAVKRRQKATYKRFVAIVVPVLVFLAIGVLGSTGYIAYAMVHPEKRPVNNTPLDYEQFLQKPIWDNRKWTGADGTEINGWLMYHDQPAPFVICTHGLNENREDVLNPGFLLWDAGYNVLAYDLRAHGQNAAETSTLGPAELDDLVATIAYAKTLKTQAGAPMCDGRIGLYGIDLGGFVSLTAAANDPTVMAVAVDTVYPTTIDFIKYRSKSILGNTDPPDSAMIENGLLQSCVRTFMGYFASGGTPPMDAAEAIAKLGDRPLLIISGKADPVLFALSQRVAAAAPNAQKVELEHSRSGMSLVKQDAETYDHQLVAFFTQARDFTPPPPPPDELTKKKGKVPPSASDQPAPPAPAPQ